MPLGLVRLSSLVQEKFFAAERNFSGPQMLCVKLVAGAISTQYHCFPFMHTTAPWNKDKLYAVYEKDEQ